MPISQPISADPHACGRSGNLPLQVSSFIGRARELEQTAAALGEARVVTLTGPAG
jgi:non-specific serine/threonine protein kinase